MKKIILILIFLFSTLFADITQYFPKLDGRVVDTANLLSSNTKEKLTKPLKFTLDYISEIRKKGWASENIFNCNDVTFAWNSNRSLIITIPDNGIITLPFNSKLEYLSCKKNGEVVFGLLFCGNSGYCGQQLFGVDTK